MLPLLNGSLLQSEEMVRHSIFVIEQTDVCSSCNVKGQVEDKCVYISQNEALIELNVMY